MGASKIGKFDDGSAGQLYGVFNFRNGRKADVVKLAPWLALPDYAEFGPGQKKRCRIVGRIQRRRGEFVHVLTDILRKFSHCIYSNFLCFSHHNYRAKRHAAHGLRWD